MLYVMFYFLTMGNVLLQKILYFLPLQVGVFGLDVTQHFGVTAVGQYYQALVDAGYDAEYNTNSFSDLHCPTTTTTNFNS